MSFKRKNNEKFFFVVWSLLNQWLGVLACAVAFCLIALDIAEICKSCSNCINITLLVLAISCVLKEITVLIILSVKESLITEKIKSEVSGMK